MKYVLNIGEDYRVLSASFLSQYIPKGAVIVDELPLGNISDYRYFDGDYIYDPLPVQEKVELTDTERINELYEALNMILNGVTE